MGLALWGCGEPSPPPAAAGADEVSIVYQTRVDGEIEPCG
jgi:hypothetical protein